MNSDFIWTNKPSLHDTRRSLILKSHPEIKKLFGYDWRSKYICVLALLIPHFLLSLSIANMNWILFLTVCYVFGATLTQSIFLAIHELSHNLFFKNSTSNKLFSIFANLPICVPYAIAFREYHKDHHAHLGVDDRDLDIPTYGEAFITNTTLTKALWMSSQIVMYALRPVLTRPKKIDIYQFVNIVVQLLFDIVIVCYWGWRPIQYMLLSILFSGGLHPCAGHFISEHYVFSKYKNDQETFSYYGGLNNLMWNVGYHNEHHDFPNVSGLRLPKLNKIAKKYYDELDVCESWMNAVFTYIFDENIGNFNRVKRAHSKKTNLHKRMTD